MTRIPSLGSRGEGWVVIQVVLFALVLALAAWGPRVDGPLAIPARILGSLLLAAGVALALAGLAALRDALTPLPHPRDDAQLVQGGAFRLVRHPIYGGLVLGAAGLGLVLASPLTLAGAGVLLGFFRLKSGREEVWLRQRYPDYAGYAATTRRLLPWVY